MKHKETSYDVMIYFAHFMLEQFECESRLDQ